LLHVIACGMITVTLSIIARSLAALDPARDGKAFPGQNAVVLRIKAAIEA
jgi:hypothetical protein